jgi:hypothetical protein
MSSQSTPLNTNSQATINTDVSKIFILNNRYEAVKLLNSTGGSLTYPAGTVLGRVSASQKVVPLTSAAVDGSAIPVGILADDYTVGAGATIDAMMCISGDIAAEKIVLQGADTLDTVVSARLIRDRIKGDTLGINLVVGNEMTGYDN